MKLISDKFSMMSFGRTEIGTPKVDENFGNNEWISYGAKNDFPQELIRLYQNSSGRHTQLINRKVDMIAGLGLKKLPGLEDFLLNKFSESKLDEIVYKSAFDLVIFGGYYLEIIWNKTGDRIARIEHVPFEKVRIAKPDPETEKIEGYFISKDWLKWRREENKPKFIHKFDQENSREYPSQLYCAKLYSPGMDYYPLPSYFSSLNWIKLDYEISTFHLKNVQNGLMPGMIIVNKMGVPPAEEREAIYNEVKQRYSGSDNAGDFIMVFAESAEKAPEFIPVQLNASDQRFKDLKEQINEELMIAHKFTPAVAGLETSGKLGSRQELEEQLDYLQTTVIKPLQIKVQDSFDKLAQINGIQDKFELNQYSLFSKEQTTTPTDKTN